MSGDHLTRYFLYRLPHRQCHLPASANNPNCSASDWFNISTSPFYFTSTPSLCWSRPRQSLEECLGLCHIKTTNTCPAIHFSYHLVPSSNHTSVSTDCSLNVTTPSNASPKTNLSFSNLYSAELVW